MCRLVIFNIFVSDLKDKLLMLVEKLSLVHIDTCF